MRRLCPLLHDPDTCAWLGSLYACLALLRIGHCAEGYRIGVSSCRGVTAQSLAQGSGEKARVVRVRVVNRGWPVYYNPYYPYYP